MEEGCLWSLQAKEQLKKLMTIPLVWFISCRLSVNELLDQFHILTHWICFFTWNLLGALLPVFCSPAYDMFAFIEVYGRKAGSYVSNYGKKILGILLGFLCKSCPEPASTEIFQEMWFQSQVLCFFTCWQPKQKTHLLSVVLSSLSGSYASPSSMLPCMSACSTGTS